MRSVTSAPITPHMRVFVRCDLDVPIDGRKIGETYRLEACLPTLKFLIEKEAHILIAGHLGRPNGKFVPELRTSVLQPFFEEHLGADNFTLAENLRFHPGEEKNDPEFVNAISENIDLYVNECFSTSHRKHASFVGIPAKIPAYAGLRLLEEVETLSKVMDEPQRPLVAVIGGAKIESKLPVINRFLEIADAVLVGGRIGLEWKNSVPERLYLPTDYATDEKDIGPRTIEGFTKMLSTAKTIVWAGPMGLYEEDEFMKGTQSIAKALADSTAFKVLGGGDTIAAVNKLNMLQSFDFVSTGGSAMLEFLSKGTLPGLEVLGYHG